MKQFVIHPILKDLPYEIMKDPEKEAIFRIVARKRVVGDKGRRKYQAF